MRTELPVIAQPRMDLAAPDVAEAQAAASLLADRTRASVLRMLARRPALRVRDGRGARGA